MKKGLKRGIVSLAVIMLVFAVSVVNAEPPEGGTEGSSPRTHFQGKGMWPGKGKVDRLTDDLGLTPEQQEQFRKQRREQGEKKRELKEKLQAKRRELREELEKPDINQGKAYALVAEINTLNGGILTNRVNGILKMKEVLTPEQFKKLQERRAKKKHGKFGQSGGPGGSGGWHGKYHGSGKDAPGGCYGKYGHW